MGRFGRTFFTADTRFGDETAADNRGFGSVAEMDELLVEAWNSVVEPTDVVWVLGGFATVNSLMNPPDEMSPASKLNGTKYLVAGPTDRPFSLAQQGPKARERAVQLCRASGFTGVVTGTGIAKKTGRPVTLPLRGGSDGMPRPVVLSAFPYDMTASDMPGRDRFAAWRPKRDGTWLLHGNDAEWVVQDHQINVGADKWGFEPVDAETVVALIEDTERGSGGWR